MSEHSINTNATADLAKVYDKRYKDGIAHWEEAPGKAVLIEALRRLCPPDQPLRLLDIGCGTGSFLKRISVEISPRWILCGADFSEIAIAQAREQLPDFHFERCDATRLAHPDGRFHIVSCYGSWEHFADPAAAIAEASRVLAPGGHMLAMIPTLGVHRTDRDDEGWYEDTEVPGVAYCQLQWNLKRTTWANSFALSGIRLMNDAVPAACGAHKPGVFYFGTKESD
jgi:ubiquinone/menaquinone biosynthesis C-methylase UbiE